MAGQGAPLSPAEAYRLFKSWGWEDDRVAKGGHLQLRHPELEGRASIPMPGRAKKTIVVDRIITDAAKVHGVTRIEFLAGPPRVRPVLPPQPELHVITPITPITPIITHKEQHDTMTPAKPLIIQRVLPAILTRHVDHLDSLVTHPNRGSNRSNVRAVLLALAHSGGEVVDREHGKAVRILEPLARAEGYTGARGTINQLLRRMVVAGQIVKEQNGPAIYRVGLPDIDIGPSSPPYEPVAVTPTRIDANTTCEGFGSDMANSTDFTARQVDQVDLGGGLIAHRVKAGTVHRAGLGLGPEAPVDAMAPGTLLEIKFTDAKGRTILETDDGRVFIATDLREV